MFAKTATRLAGMTSRGVYHFTSITNNSFKFNSWGLYKKIGFFGLVGVGVAGYAST